MNSVRVSRTFRWGWCLGGAWRAQDISSLFYPEIFLFFSLSFFHASHHHYFHSSTVNFPDIFQQFFLTWALFRTFIRGIAGKLPEKVLKRSWKGPEKVLNSTHIHSGKPQENVQSSEYVWKQLLCNATCFKLQVIATVLFQCCRLKE